MSKNDSERRIMVYVVGTTFDNRQKHLKKFYEEYVLKKELSIRLKREPTNKYDKYAVKVIIGKKQVGYIPRKVSKLITEALKEKMISRVELNDIHVFDGIYGLSLTLVF